MSDANQESTTAAPNGAAPTSEAAAPSKPARVRRAFTALKGHPLGLIALAGAAVALIEVEFAVGVLAGIGATALLATKSGPEARQEVLAKSKWAIERVKGALPSRAKPEAVPAAAENAAAPAAENAAPPPAA